MNEGNVGPVVLWVGFKVAVLSNIPMYIYHIGVLNLLRLSSRRYFLIINPIRAELI